MTLEKPFTLADLPATLTVRPVTLDDVDNFVALAHRWQIEHMGEATTSTHDIRTEWSLPEFKLDLSTRAVFAQDGTMVAYGEVWDTSDLPVRPYYWARVHPEWIGQGIGSALFHWAESRARQVIDRVPADARVVMQAGIVSTDTYTQQFLRSMDMAQVRRSWEMLIEMEAAPSAATWPEGITVTSFAEAEAAGRVTMRDVFEAVEAAFQDHRGYVPDDQDKAFARWEHYIYQDEHYTPAEWFLAMDGDRIAGMSLCRPQGWDSPTTAYVMELGVLRAYRKRGIGLALLLHSFDHYWRKGQHRVTLHVDASSLTGATRLYERAGMHVHRAYDQFEKELRPGKEYSKQSI